MTIRLSRAALPSLPSQISVPNYSPKQLKPGIVHIGVGNFHRAHQSVYLDQLFRLGKSLDWALVGTGVGFIVGARLGFVGDDVGEAVMPR